MSTAQRRALTQAEASMIRARSDEGLQSLFPESGELARQATNETGCFRAAIV